MDSCETEDSEYTQALFKNGRYQNPWKTWNEMGFCAFLKFVLPFTKDLSDIPKSSVRCYLWVMPWLPVKYVNILYAMPYRTRFLVLHEAKQKFETIVQVGLVD